ncbi:MAG: hypothetical protein V1822_04590, partial [Candidatus Micrarchaeota archaeon]
NQSGNLSLAAGTPLSQIRFTPQKNGTFIFQASVEDFSGKPIYSQSKSLQAFEKSFVSVTLLRNTQINENASIARIMINASGPVESIWAVVGGRTYEFGSNEIQIDLEPKPYDAKIVWLDSLGGQHEAPLHIRAPDSEQAFELAPGVMFKKQNLNVASILGQGAVALIILSILVFIKRRSEEFRKY